MRNNVIDVLENLRKESEKMKSWAETVRTVKEEIENEGYSDVGDGAEIRLGCTRALLDAIALELIQRGYWYGIAEVERDGVKTRTYVLKKGGSK